MKWTCKAVMYYREFHDTVMSQLDRWSTPSQS